MTTTPAKSSAAAAHNYSWPWRKKSTLRFYLKVLCCILFLLVYFGIFLQESINATKLKQNALRQQQHEQLKRSSTWVAGGEGVATSNNVAPRAPVENGSKKKRRRGAGGGGGGSRGSNIKTVAHGDSTLSLLQPLPAAANTTTSTTKGAGAGGVNPIYEYSDELNAALEQEFEARNHLLWEECANLKLTNRFPPNAWEFFISPGHNLAWCPVFKAASSIWLFYFNILGGFNVDYLQRTQTPPLELARKKFPRPTEEELADALSTSTSFLIVREPFERLLSAYRNKFEGSRNKFYKQLGDRIVKMFRNGGGNLTGTQVVAKNHKGPTFNEFIQYILRRAKQSGVSKLNEHFQPIYSFCSPCTINFTLIIKTETMDKGESEYVWRRALLEEMLYDKLPKKKTRLRAISNRSIVDTKTVKFKYFSKLSVNIFEELLSVYGPDFQLFGYNSTAYYEVLQRTKEKDRRRRK